MLTAEFDYALPPELIAGQPLPDRSGSRLLVVDRVTGAFQHCRFRDLPRFIRAGDLLVLNDTRVAPARFLTEDGSREVLKLEALSPTRWRCMVRPGKRFRLGHGVTFGGAAGVVREVCENGDRIIEFDQPVDEERYGRLALPHYMGREEVREDRERYQTVFARQVGAIAAPTAGLHFTPELLAALPHVFVTLHVGVGTFQPVKVENVADHRMHSERYEVGAEAAAAIRAAARVIAVGTTAVRTLETVARDHGELVPASGATDIFIYPGCDFHAVDALITNFHLPKSTLLMLVSAFAGRDLILRAYEEAIRQGYRFYSYGDCMLIL